MLQEFARSGILNDLPIRTLQQLAVDEKYTHPRGAELIKNNFYVDDLIASFCSVEEAQQGIGSLNDLTRSGQFQLRIWASNHPEALKGVDQNELLASIEVALSHDSSDTIKALGVQWTPSTDQLHINVQEEINTKLTKRKVLSVAAKIFDPLGLLAPATVGLKIILQEIWKTNLDWDDEIPTILADQWLAAQQELHLLSEIRIPRWMQYINDTK